MKVFIDHIPLFRTDSHGHVRSEERSRQPQGNLEPRTRGSELERARGFWTAAQLEPGPRDLLHGHHLTKAATTVGAAVAAGVAQTVKYEKQKRRFR